MHKSMTRNLNVVNEGVTKRVLWFEKETLSTISSFSTLNRSSLLAFASSVQEETAKLKSRYFKACWKTQNS